MFQGTRSRGESIAKGVQFMLGTLAGVLVGMLAATLLSNHELLSMVAIVAAVFLAFQANIAAYGVMVFWITIILGLMFGMLGYFSPDLLWLRLQEGAVGATCGALVASAVLVRRERTATADAAITFLRRLGELVDGAAAGLLDRKHDPALAARILAAEQSFRDLNATAHAEHTGLGAAHNEELRRRLLLLEGCEQWSRELGRICLQPVELDDPSLVQATREAVARIDRTLPDLINRLTTFAAITRIGGEPAEDLGHAVQDDPAHRAVRLLLRIDSGLVHLASR
jgi:uncharacterized membrane protein YccC